jgi:hypothetical protein
MRTLSTVRSGQCGALSGWPPLRWRSGGEHMRQRGAIRTLIFLLKFPTAPPRIVFSA